MHSTKVISGINNNELEMGVSAEASWHNQFSSAYIYIGGLNPFINEGDLSVVFSQYGDIVDIRLVRDKHTGKSKSFAFLAYEDQRSTVLAVDNFNGYELCGRTIRVDHVKSYKIPNEFLEVDESNEHYLDNIYKPSGTDGQGWGPWRVLNDEEEKILAFQNKVKSQFQDTQVQEEQVVQKRSDKVILDEDERVLIFNQWEQLFLNKMEESIDEKPKKEKKDKKKDKKKLKKEKKIKKHKKNKEP